MRNILAVPLLFSVPLAFGASGPIPDPAIDLDRPAVKTKQVAVFAGGCFWCTEAVLESLAGVDKVVSGYAGGQASDADYKLVSEGRTGHTESIEITFDASQITYGQLLKVFFSVAHDPTTLNRQGPDHGTQYRSAVFYIGADQKRVVEAYVAQLGQARIFAGPIVTQLVPLKKFYAAEAYHQDFVKLNPGHGYVVVNALPKLKKLKQQYPELVKR